MARKSTALTALIEKKEPDLLCPWNDHGIRCNERGSISNATNGEGPWYCRTHYWRLRGYHEKQAVNAKQLSYRERWYAERGLPYEPPKLEGTGHFKSVATQAQKLLARLHSHELGPAQSREPGEDAREENDDYAEEF